MQPEQITEGKGREFGNSIQMSNGKLFGKEYNTMHTTVHSDFDLIEGRTLERFGQS